MSSVDQVMRDLKAKGSEQARRTFARHGADPSRLYGVKVADMKVIAKGIRGEQDLALALYDTGNYDAMYLAGLVIDGRLMTRRQLDAWARNAGWQMIAEYTVPWAASESPHGAALADKWIDAKREHVASAGWNTWAGLVATRPDEELDLDRVGELLDRVRDTIDAAPPRVRYCMNGFVIAVGCYCRPLAARAKTVAKALGRVEVDMGDTACKVPVALDMIAKVESMGKAHRKRKTIRC